MEVITLDASSLLSAVALINSNISKELNFMHLKVIVLSEEISRAVNSRIHSSYNTLQAYKANHQHHCK